MLSRLFRTAKTKSQWPQLQRRTYSTEPPPPQPAASRLSRMEARLPRFLRHITTPLRNAPVSHVTAFLVLHELTAIVPLFGLAALFHYTEYLPKSFSEGAWVQDGTEKFGRWLRKKGWISEAEEIEADEQAKDGEINTRTAKGEDKGVRIVVELATAYAITKAMLPARLLMSVWCTPWFARWTVLPVTNVIRRVFKKA